jgi:hypothetical protein
VYSLVCGEGGLSPDYFLNHMGLREANDYITGLNRRYRQQWEQTRLLCRLIHKVETGKELELDFPWDEEDEDTAAESRQEHERRLEELRQRAKVMEGRMNKKEHEKDSMADTIQGQD